jgi:peptide/nickel transport system permease protein
MTDRIAVGMLGEWAQRLLGSESHGLQTTFRRIRRNTLSVVGLGIVGGLVLIALIFPVIVPRSQVELTHLDSMFLPPSLGHPFGTDEMGRDLLVRILWGTSISLQIGILVVATAMGIGVPLGAIAGFFGGRIDDAIMRLTDLFLAFPSILLALAVAAALGPSITNALIAIAITWWPWYTRIVRGMTLSLKEEKFVEAARSLGASKARLIFKHILPNCVTPVIVNGTLDIGYAILATAALGFLGVGAQPPLPEWGLMISTGRLYMPSRWWVSTFPGLAILVTVLGFNLVGDAIRDVMDPRLRA